MKANTAARLLGFGAVLVVVQGAMGCASVAVSTRSDLPLLEREVGEGPASSALRPLPKELPPKDDDETKAARLRVAAAAASSVGSTPIIVGGVRYRFDCSGIASGIYARAGFPLGDSRHNRGLDTHTLYELVQRTGWLHKGDPLPGDLVFFDHTYDYNRNGKVDDPLSHVGVVESVDDDGTVLFVHRVGRQVVRARMNLAQPSLRQDDKGRPLNHYLRAASGAHLPKTTGELFVAYGSLPLSEPQRLVASR